MPATTRGFCSWQTLERITPRLFKHWPIVSLACIACVIFIAITTFCPLPYGLLTYNSTSGHWFLMSCDQSMRPQPTVCAEDWYSFSLLAISRCSAYFIYPLIISLFLTKLNHTRTLLQRSWLSMYVPFHDLHDLHVIAGTIVGFDAMIHSFCHLLRWGVQGRIHMTWESYTGLSGAIACAITPLIVAPMRYEWIKKRLSWECRKALHYLCIVWGIALCFHAPQQQICYIVGVPVALYMLDFALGSILRTHLVESPILTKMENGVELTFEHPKGFEGRAGYIFVNLPWISKNQWHAFSLFQHPNKPNHSSVCMNVNGDWTQAVHDAVCSRTVRPVWISGPFASPYSTAVDYEDLILVASGIGITPAMDIINAYRTGNRRMSLIWTCRDASLLEYYLQHGHFDKDGWTLIYYTGKRKLNVKRKDLPETLCIFYGRPYWDVVVREIITSIELGVGLPEQVIAEKDACMDDILQTRQELDRAGIATPFERFRTLFKLILCRQSASDLFVELRHFAHQHGSGSAKCTLDFNFEAFAHLVHHLMPGEFSSDEVIQLFDRFVADRQQQECNDGQATQQIGLEQFKEFVNSVGDAIFIDEEHINETIMESRKSYAEDSVQESSVTGRALSAWIPGGRRKSINGGRRASMGGGGRRGSIASFVLPGRGWEDGDMAEESSISRTVSISIDLAKAPPPPPPLPQLPRLTEGSSHAERESNSSSGDTLASKTAKTSTSTAPGAAPRRLPSLIESSERGEKPPKTSEQGDAAKPHEMLNKAPSMFELARSATTLRPTAHAEIERTFTAQKLKRMASNRTMLTKTRGLKVFGATEKDVEEGEVIDDEHAIEEIDEFTLSKWQILYCGGAQPVVDALTKISEELNVDFRMEKFDW